MEKLDPIVISEIKSCFPYEIDQQEAVEKALQKMKLTPLQAKNFVEKIHDAVTRAYGHYATLDEFKRTANEEYLRFSKRTQWTQELEKKPKPDYIQPRLITRTPYIE